MTTNFELQRIHELFGVRIEALQAHSLDASTFESLRRLVHENGFVLLKAQRLDAGQIVALARRFGEPLPGYRPEFTHPDYPELVQLGNIRGNGEVNAYLNTQGIEWHSDATGAVLPANVSMLYALEAPKSGGDTLFASATHAYAALDEDTKRRLAGLEVVNSFDHHNDRAASFEGANFGPRDFSLRQKNPDKIEPLVQRHPVTGEQHLFVTHQMIREVVGMDYEEGMRLVMSVVAHATRPEFVYRHRWEPGDLIVFDNRSTMHSATAYDYPGERRLMYQLIVGQADKVNKSYVR